MALTAKDYYIYFEKEDTYKTDPTTTAADRVRVQDFKLEKTPNLVPSGDAMPYRQGDKLVPNGYTVDVSFKHRIKEFTLLNDAGATWPEAADIIEGGGYTGVWADPTPGTIYTWTYSLIDFHDLHESVWIDKYQVLADVTDCMHTAAGGCRWDTVRTYEPGKPITITATGKGASWTAENMTGAGIPAITYDALGEILFQPDGVTITYVGAAAITTTVVSMEFRTAFDLVEVPGGGESGVGKVELHADKHYEFDIVIDAVEAGEANEQNAKLIRDAGGVIKMALVNPCPTATNTYEETWYGQIQSIEEGAVGTQHATYTLKCVGVYSHATTPGLIPTTAPTIVFRTDNS